MGGTVTAPLHTRPFNLEHARAGAPFCRADGTEFEILKWDRKHTQCIVAVSKQDAAVNTYRVDGTETGNRPTHALVMTPLGMLDGKPVFVGDKLVYDHGDFIAGPRAITEYDLPGLRWPAPAPVYPETKMTLAEIMDVWRGTHYGQPDGLLVVANAALRHAVDAGQVVAIYDAKHMVKVMVNDTMHSVKKLEVVGDQIVAYITIDDKCSRDLGKAERLLESLGYRSAGDGEWSSVLNKEPMCIIDIVNIGSVIGTRKVINYVSGRVLDHAARDMAIAEAVREECQLAVGSGNATIKSNLVICAILNLDLAAIIAGVKS